MRNLFTLLLITVSLLPLAAQDYAPFRMGHTPYFQAGDSIYSLRITSVQVQGGDSVFEFNPRVVPVSNITLPPGCAITTGTFLEAVRTPDNLFGARMMKSNSQYRFIFTGSDTFLLKPHALIGEVWSFSQSLTATMQSKTVGLVQGFPDSIATISLSNGNTIIISKNFGLTSARSFYSFLSPTTSATSLILKRIPEAGIGQAINHPLRIFDFQVGDKFLYYGYTESSGGMTCSEQWTTSEVMGRTDSPSGNSITYELKQQTLSKTYGHPTAPPQFCPGTSGQSLSAFSIDTLSISNTDLPHLSHISREYVVNQNQTFTSPLSTGHQISQYNGRFATAFRWLVQDTCNSAYYGIYDYEEMRNYAEGLGLVREVTGGFGHSSRALIAYKKGSETYGNWQPLVLSREAKIEKQTLQIYPNPFTSDFTLQLPEADADSEAAEVTIYNLQGQQVFRQKVSSLSSQTGVNLALGHLPTGLYLLHLQQGEKSYSAKVQRQ